MTERLFAFRWDVDHRVCATDGLPRIRKVCRDFGVPNTFFVNMGRSYQSASSGSAPGWRGPRPSSPTGKRST